VLEELTAASLRALAADSDQGAFAGALADAPQPAFRSVFAWDHAQPAGRLDARFQLDTERRAGLCGDFFCAAEAGGVEAAALSGQGLADALLALLRAPADASDL